MADEEVFSSGSLPEPAFSSAPALACFLLSRGLTSSRLLKVAGLSFDRFLAHGDKRAFRGVETHRFPGGVFSLK